jgi:putative flavoprotein involved in K+ transport
MAHTAGLFKSDIRYVQKNDLARSIRAPGGSSIVRSIARQWVVRTDEPQRKTMENSKSTAMAAWKCGDSAYDSLVIGGGQAALAAGYYLKQAGIRFMLLDAGKEIGAAWKQRWDSLRLFTPARYNNLPGMPFPGNAYSLPTKDDVAGYLQSYAQRFDLPVRLGTRVTSLRAADGRYVIGTDTGDQLTAHSVIVATGANQKPYVPQFAAALRPQVVQVHSSAYRRPSQLPNGDVLVVGAGNSGAQIACELAETGRRIVLSGRHTGSLPRRLLGRDIYDWLWPTIMRPSIDTALGRHLMQGRLFAGDPLVGMSARSLTRPGLERAGKMIGVRDGLPLLDGGRVLTDIAAIVWCRGFHPDFSWIELPVLGLEGYPRHRRGLAYDAPGLGFLGMRYQFRMGSALLGGVGEDAAYVTSHTTSFLRST